MNENYKLFVEALIKDDKKSSAYFLAKYEAYQTIYRALDRPRYTNAELDVEKEIDAHCRSAVKS
jgi:hypothetical protein